MAFRAAALLVGLAPLGLSEASLWVFDGRRAIDASDPFVGFSAVYPLFEPGSRGVNYEIAPNRRQHFFPDSFAKVKAADEFRIFCVGGSTVAGHPYAPATSFTTFLELGLKASDPTRQWRVVNCGGISYASYRLAPIVRELLDYQPDLVILCTGHNEFLEARTYRQRRRIPQEIARPLARFGRLRTVSVLRAALESCSGLDAPTCAAHKPILPAEVDAILDYRGGIAEYHRDDDWRRDVIDHFAYNLERMLDMGRAAGVPMLLVAPPANLRDCPPFKSEHRPGLSERDEQAWQELWDQARASYRKSVHHALARLEQAAGIDDQYAGLQFEIGQCYEALGDWKSAHAAYRRAKELDVCPLRMLGPMRAAMGRLARQGNVPLVDAHALLAQRSRGGIPGNDWLVDHVHPSIEGHQVLADAIIDQMSSTRMVRTTADSRYQRRAAYRAQVSGLPGNYFAHGAERIEMYRKWTQSRLGPPRRAR